MLRRVRTLKCNHYNEPTNNIICTLTITALLLRYSFSHNLLINSLFCHRMSNFQRTRSKVWWGDSPPNIGNPVAPQPEWNNKPNNDQDWEPQLPHWIANQPTEKSKSNDHISPQNVQNQWPLRHGSPGSHKSQDSGFSDSDSSPPSSQYYPSPQNDSKITNKSSSSSDSNNNENITVKEVIHFQNTPQSKDVVDNARTENNNSTVPTPKPRLRSSSVIQTPYDLQKYYEVHHDEEHMALLKEHPEVTLNKSISVQETPKKSNNFCLKPNNTVVYDDNLSDNNDKENMYKNVTTIEIRETPRSKVINKENSPYSSAIIRETKEFSPVNINIISPSKKYPSKKQFVSSQESDSTKVSKVAKVKDLETNKNKSEENLEYIKLANNNEIAVNNQPRVRSPISNISYVPTERITKPRPECRRSISNEDNIPIITTPKFQRNRLNKSLNFEGQKLDQQILDIQEGHHSLGYIDEEISSKQDTCDEERVHQPSKAILGKNIMDSLNFKPTKNPGPRAKQRMATKTDKFKDQTCSFRIFPNKREKLQTVEIRTENSEYNNRVPSLGLPRSTDQNDWVVVGHPEQERLISNYTERLIDGNVKANINKEVVKPPRNRRISPPPQFKDNYNSEISKTKEVLIHDSKREKLKEEQINFTDLQMNLACTSTPKMLPPREFMNGLTPASNSKGNCRKNLINTFSG